MSQYGIIGLRVLGHHSDPSRVSQSDFEGFTSNGTRSTWNYGGYSATGGNTLTLASAVMFSEHNTTKTDGFLGHTFTWSFSGYAWDLIQCLAFTAGKVNIFRNYYQYILYF